jgi:hypothetical protein
MSAKDILNRAGALLVGMAACACLDCGGDVSAAPGSSVGFAVTAESFTCTQVSPGRPANRQSVSGTVDATGAPANVLVRRGSSARLEHAAAAATPVPGYQSGYFEQKYQLFAWALGSEGENDYFLLLPAGGVPAGTFTAELHLYFNHGDSGWWQKVLTCTAP